MSGNDNVREYLKDVNTKEAQEVMKNCYDLRREYAANGNGWSKQKQMKHVARIPKDIWEKYNLNSLSQNELRQWIKDHRDFRVS